MRSDGARDPDSSCDAQSQTRGLAESGGGATGWFPRTRCGGRRLDLDRRSESLPRCRGGERWAEHRADGPVHSQPVVIADLVVRIDEPEQRGKRVLAAGDLKGHRRHRARVSRGDLGCLRNHAAPWPARSCHGPSSCCFETSRRPARLLQWTQQSAQRTPDERLGGFVVALESVTVTVSSTEEAPARIAPAGIGRVNPTATESPSAAPPTFTSVQIAISITGCLGEVHLGVVRDLDRRRRRLLIWGCAKHSASSTSVRKSPGLPEFDTLSSRTSRGLPPVSSNRSLSMFHQPLGGKR